MANDSTNYSKNVQVNPEQQMLGPIEPSIIRAAITEVDYSAGDTYVQVTRMPIQRAAVEAVAATVEHQPSVAPDNNVVDLGAYRQNRVAPAADSGANTEAMAREVVANVFKPQPSIDYVQKAS